MVKPSKPKFVLGVDLDGVVAEFYEGLRLIAADWKGVSPAKLPKRVSYGLPEWGIKDRDEYDDLHRFAVTQKNLFNILKPIKGAPSVLRKINRDDIRIRIITHRLYIKYVHLLTVQQTVGWLEKYGIPYWDLCFMKDKAAVGADLYIEDSPENIKELQKGHDVIIFTNSTNKGLQGTRANSWEDVESIVNKKLNK